MRRVEWTDEEGYKHVRLVRDSDPEEMYLAGIPVEPPDIRQLDWKQIQCDLHNALLDRKLITFSDVVQSPGQTGITSAILSVLRKRVTMLYRLKQKEQQKRMSKE